jgi:hypothetical protein
VGLARRGAFFLASGGAAAAILAASVASCTHGNYDGSFDSAGLEIFTNDAGTDSATSPPVVQTVKTKEVGPTKITTADNVFEIDVAPQSYQVDVTITITQLADRTTESGFIVPVYAVSVVPDGPSQAPSQIIFRGNTSNSGGAPGQLLPVVLSGGATTPLPIVGAAPQNGGGPTTNQATLWGLTKNLTASYTLALFPQIGNGGQNQLLEPSNANCLTECCNIQKNPGPGPNGGQLYGTDVGCACESANPNFDCFRRCSDIEASAQRCLDLKIQPSGTLACNINCMAPGSACCYVNGGGLTCSGPNGTTGSGNMPCSYTERCTDDSQCGGATCCAFDDESICSTKCPPERRTCPTVTDAGTPACGGGICTKAGNCSIRTCGASPSGCK